MKTNPKITKCCLLLGMLMLPALGMRAQKVLMNIHKTDGGMLSVNTEEVECVTFEEKSVSATVYWGCTDDIPTSIAKQGTAVDIYGDEEEITFYAGGHCAWVAVPKYWKADRLRFGIANLSTETVQIGGYIVYYAMYQNMDSGGGDWNRNLSTHVQRTATPVIPSSVLIYYGSSSTVPETLTPEGYQTVLVSGNSGSVQFQANNRAVWIAIPNSWVVNSIKETAFNTSLISSFLTQEIEDYTMYYEYTTYVNTTPFKITFSKS